MARGIHFHCACAFHELTCRNLYSGTGTCAGTHAGAHTGTHTRTLTGAHTGTLTGTHTGTLAGAQNWIGCSSNCWAVTTTPNLGGWSTLPTGKGSTGTCTGTFTRTFTGTNTGTFTGTNRLGILTLIPFHRIVANSNQLPTQKTVHNNCTVTDRMQEKYRQT